MESGYIEIDRYGMQKKMQGDVTKLLVIIPSIIQEVNNTSKVYDKFILSLLSMYVVM